MAKLILDVCYKCKGMTEEEYSADVFNTFGGCAITRCEMCGYNIPNTREIYKKNVLVNVEKGIIK